MMSKLFAKICKYGTAFDKPWQFQATTLILSTVELHGVCNCLDMGFGGLHGLVVGLKSLHISEKASHRRLTLLLP